MTTKSSIIRDKMRRYNKPFIEKALLENTIKKFADGYTIADLCNRKIIAPIKKGKIYANLLYDKYINPYIVGSLYFGDSPYMFGGLDVYNRYHFTTQIPEWRVVYNTTISGNKILAGCKLIFKKVRPSFFYGIRKRRMDGYTVNIMTPERALIELFKEDSSPEYIGTMPDNVNKTVLINMAKNNVPKHILQRLIALADDKKAHKR